MVELLHRRGAREHDRDVALEQVADELVRALERRHLLDEVLVDVAPLVADVVAELAVDVITHERRDELVAAHPDGAMDSPERQRDVVLSEGAVPRDRVLVVGVDERAVDVEQGGFRH